MNLSKSVLLLAAELGLDEAQVRHMVGHAAPFTSPQGNRRYESYVFLMDGEDVLDMQELVEEAPASNCTGEQRTYSCPDCEGEGCAACDGAGVVHCTEAEYERRVLDAKII